MRALTIAPLLRNSIGFDRFNDLFESTFGEDKSANPSYPPYNIEKLSESSYRITMAVAGFSEDDLDLTTHQGQLIVEGKINPTEISEDEKQEEIEYLHKGIAFRSFKQTFSLTDYIRVEGANISNGLLHIILKREVPEEAKPKKIEIGS
jgi:molecular chaperone IbpA